jgi:hypothetical protein
MKRKKKPGYYTLLASGAGSLWKDIGESVGSGTSALVALVAFQRVDRAMEELYRFGGGRAVPVSTALTHSQFAVHQRKRWT